MALTLPKGYTPKLSIYDTQTAIGLIKRDFQDRLSTALNLKRVTAPLFVDPATGLNDNLNGIERPVTFDVKETGKNLEIVYYTNVDMKITGEIESVCYS